MFGRTRSVRRSGSDDPDPSELVSLTHAFPEWNPVRISTAFLGQRSSVGVIVSRDGRLTHIWYNTKGLEAGHGLVQLTGPLSSTIGAFASLTRLDLSYNLLTGPIPGSFLGLSALRELVLEGNKLTGALGTVCSLQELEVLNLASNQFDSQIPPDITSLSNLRILNLAHNKLTGSIPNDIGNLSALKQLIISHNLLEGVLPPSLGSLMSLEIIFIYEPQLSPSIIPPYTPPQSHSDRVLQSEEDLPRNPYLFSPADLAFWIRRKCHGNLGSVDTACEAILLSGITGAQFFGMREDEFRLELGIDDVGARLTLMAEGARLLEAFEVSLPPTYEE
ncbi:hypothetical protein BC830DRAFT_1174860 [Chytriomyces sp. MP71]|nr:hypothetical protein BC830DRAFT_1174860 [Chytriomyces sp. MP71]